MLPHGLVAGLMALSLAADRDPSADPAGGKETFPLWTEKAPLAVGDSRFDRPQLTSYPPKGTPSGAAVVICPGGGYGFLATDHEGKQMAEYYAGLGIHAFVLQYRIVQKERPGPLGTAPLLDAQRALRTVRAKAKAYGIDPKKVGLTGFSAGGHLASTAGTHFDAGKINSEDPVARESCRPDWLVLCYPVVSSEKGVTHGGSMTNLLGKEPKTEDVEFFCNDKHVTKETPPTFIFQTDEDTAVPAENAVRFYLALRKAKVPAELHVYEKGQHGVGLGTDPAWLGKSSTKDYCQDWSKHLTAWLTVRGVIAAK